MSNEKLKTGDYFSVVRWTNRIDNSYVSQVLKVEVVDYPFISFSQPRDKSLPTGYVRTLSLEHIIVKKLSDEYVSNVLGIYIKPKTATLHEIKSPLDKIE